MRLAVKPLNAEPKRNESIVPFAATIVAPAMGGARRRKRRNQDLKLMKVEDKVEEAENYEKLAEELTNASPLEIMDKALEKFGNDIAIAFSVQPDLNLHTIIVLNHRYTNHHTGCPILLYAINQHQWSLAVLMVILQRPGWWWEDAKDKECGLHKGNIKDEIVNGNGNGAVHANGTTTVADIFNTKDIVSLSRPGVENLLKLENRREPWLVVLYAPWCCFCQAMEGSYVELAEKLANSGVKVGKFRADGEQKAFAQQELQLGSFPTILFFPRHSSQPIKYPSEKRDVDSLLAFVNALR
ncbi:5'-adenylylsulfate reductase 1, chloroplastic-like isoform X1 [Nicotiana tomentosiformis]|uniref:5'-adenylylsulfate reductase 1, chloroplastic-like isoform X1 n=1 Tax=Nicotiana tomentosiformis TaxID=4098 RepID=UPI0008789B4A|nr:5'-adenylylsulfate reductase 1, chloroplastic-like isoform X1 [Nicotiana tomentosiformis]